MEELVFKIYNTRPWHNIFIYIQLEGVIQYTEAQDSYIYLFNVIR